MLPSSRSGKKDARSTPWVLQLAFKVGLNYPDCFESFSPLTEGVITTRSNRMKFTLGLNGGTSITLNTSFFGFVT